MPTTLVEIFRDSETHHRLSLFDQPALKIIEAMLFDKNGKPYVTPSHLSVCVASLENVKLFNSNLDVVDEAFEYLVGKSSKGEKGQYFTPSWNFRYARSNFEKTWRMKSNCRSERRLAQSTRACCC